MSNIEKAKRARLVYLIIGAVCAAVGVAALALHFALSDSFIAAKNYLPLCIIFVAAAIGMYSAVFLLFASFDMAQAARLIPVAEELGTANVAAIAEKMGWREKPTKKLIKKCKKRGFLTDN